MLRIKGHNARKKRKRKRMLLLLQIDDPKIQQDRFIVGAQAKRVLISQNRLIRAVCSRINDPEVTDGADVIRLLANDRLKPTLGCWVISRR
jgi:hypothetical protein